MRALQVKGRERERERKSKCDFVKQIAQLFHFTLLLPTALLYVITDVGTVPAKVPAATGLPRGGLSKEGGICFCHG